MITSNPKVSVVMPVFNRQKFVAYAVRSILIQSFTDFEFIIIDDCSTDDTNKILNSINDHRIKFLKLKENKGNYYARNMGMEQAKGKYICVMDSDDIALPNRIQRQFEFMEANQKIGLCGSFVKVIDSDEIITAPEDHEEIKVWSLCNIMFRHPTVFIRTEFLKKYKLKYNDSFRYAGDYDFLVKAAHLFPVTNIQEVLLEYRKHPEQISSANKLGQVKVVQQVILSQLNNFKKSISDEDKQLHLALMNRVPLKNESELIPLKKWANFLLEQNNETYHYNSVHLANFLKSLLKSILKSYKLNSLKKTHPHFYKTVSRIGINKTPGSPKLIVTLTSYPLRIPTIHITINTLLNQTVKPDMLILWLAQSQFPHMEKDLPHKLLRLRKYGLTINWCENMKSYTKLIPALKLYPNDILVTADDDVYYNPDWLEKLYDSYINNKSSIHCHRMHRIKLDETKKPLNYLQWEFCSNQMNESFLNFLTGFGGVLYPPHSLHPNVLKHELFQSLAPHADDIWFWAMAVLNHTRIKVIDNGYNNPITISDTQDIGLWRTVNIKGANDLQLKNVLDYFFEIKEILNNEISNLP